MADCCLPNLGCLSIPVLSTDVAGAPGQNGISPTIEVGTVTTGAPGDPVVVTNVSIDPSVAKFDFSIPEGQPGTTGEQGVAGVSRLYSISYDIFSYDPIYWISLPESTFTIYGGTLVNVGDSLTINLIVQKRLSNESGSALANRRIRFNSTVCANSCNMSSASSIYYYTTKCEIIRTGVSDARCITTDQYEIGGNSASDLGYQEVTRIVDLTGISFTADNTIDVQLQQQLASQIVFKSITIDKTTAI